MTQWTDARFEADAFAETWCSAPSPGLKDAIHELLLRAMAHAVEESAHYERHKCGSDKATWHRAEQVEDFIGAVYGDDATLWAEAHRFCRKLAKAIRKGKVTL